MTQDPDPYRKPPRRLLSPHFLVPTAFIASLLLWLWWISNATPNGDNLLLLLRP